MIAARNSIYDKKLREISHYPKVVAYYFKEWKEYNMAIHKHDRVEIMYVLKGRCTIETTEYNHTLSRGDCILLDAGCPHSLYVEKGKPCKMLNVEFGFEQAEGAGDGMDNLLAKVQTVGRILEDNNSYVIVKDTEDIYELLKNLIKELDERGTDSEFMIRTLIYQIFISIGRRLEELSSAENGASSNYVKKAIRYMNENYASDLLVEDIASSISIHTNYLHRIFKEHTGQTPMDYLQGLRIKKAEVLLAYTDIPVIDVASDAGFGSRQYFSYVFKKYTGLTPMKYRREYCNLKWNSQESLGEIG